MMTWFLFALQFLAIASALVGGVFLAFSDFIMRSLGRSEPSSGIEAMQVINREVVRSVFVSLLLILAGASPLMMGYAFVSLEGPPQTLTALGGAIYLVGAFGVTVVFNIPKNNRLDRHAPDSPDSLAYWNDVYLPRWTAWNHVRTAACMGSACCYAGASVALLVGSHA